jgi:uncharacterized phage-associated protein
MEAAAALHRIAIEDSGEGLSRARTYGLLFYAQGISLATVGEPLFEATFRPTGYGFEIPELEERFGAPFGRWWLALSEVEPGALGDNRVLHEVLRVFGPLNAQALASAIRSEAPWREARAGQGDTALMGRTDIHDHFAEMLDDGRDVIAELDLAKYPDRPEWEQPFKVAVNVKCLAGHPMFVETESRDLRRRLDLGELPDTWNRGDTPGAGGDEGLSAVAMR